MQLIPIQMEIFFLSFKNPSVTLKMGQGQLSEYQQYHNTECQRYCIMLSEKMPPSRFLKQETGQLHS